MVCTGNNLIISIMVIKAHQRKERNKVNFKNKWEIFSNFVAFSDYMKFIKIDSYPKI
jgi:hypothetical protein